MPPRCGSTAARSNFPVVPRFACAAAELMLHPPNVVYRPVGKRTREEGEYVRRARLVVPIVAVAAIAAFAAQAIAGPSHAQRQPLAAAAGPAVEPKTIGYVTIFGDPVQLRFARVFQAAANAVGW